MHTVKLSNSFIRLLDGTLLGTTTAGQSETGSNGNERVAHIPQSFSAGASTSDGLMSYLGHSEEYGVPIHYHYSQVHVDLEW